MYPIPNFPSVGIFILMPLLVAKAAVAELQISAWLYLWIRLIQSSLGAQEGNYWHSVCTLDFPEEIPPLIRRKSQYSTPPLCYDSFTGFVVLGQV